MSITVDDNNLWLFVRAWILAAHGGHCDDLGGAECQRVFVEWAMAGCPLPCRTFILERANKGIPPDPSPTDYDDGPPSQRF